MSTPPSTATALPDELVSWLRWLSEHAGATPEQAMAVPTWDELLGRLDHLATGLARTLHPVAGPTAAWTPLPGSAEQLLAVAFWHVAQLRELLAVGLAPASGQSMRSRSSRRRSVPPASSTLITR